MKKILLCLITAVALQTARSTPFHGPLLKSDGTPFTNQITLTPWPPQNNTWTVVGTNIVLATPIVITPTNTGAFSNWALPNFYRATISNSTVAGMFKILDTTNDLPLAIYATNMPVFPGVALSSHDLITNLLGFEPANAANIGSIAQRSSNDFALATSLGSIAQRSSNDFALASSIGSIAQRSSNDFALVTSLGSIASRGSNDFQLAGNYAYNNYTGIVAALNFPPATNAPGWFTADNQTNAYSANTLYTNMNRDTLLIGVAVGGTIINFTNNGIGYHRPVTNDFTIALTTNATWKADNSGILTNVQNWYQK